VTGRGNDKVGGFTTEKQGLFRRDKMLYDKRNKEGSGFEGEHVVKS
jgi:hypothetical protein